MRPIVTLLLVLIAVGILGFAYLAVSLRGISSAVASLPGTITSDEIRLSAGQTPVEVLLMQCVTLRKTVDDVVIEYPCYRNEGETLAEFGARCKAEFAEFCRGYGG